MEPAAPGTEDLPLSFPAISKQVKYILSPDLLV